MKILRVGLIDPVDFQHPWKQVDFVNLIVYSQVFETAYAPHRRSGKVAPMLFAEPLKEEEHNGGKKVYSAEVRVDVRFSDGTPMTVDHVVNSLTQNSYLAAQTDIQAKGNRVYFETDLNSSTLALRLSISELSVVLDRGDTFIGTGAYMRDPSSTPEFTRLVRNPHYRKSVDIDEIQFRSFPRDEEGKASVLIEAVNNGEVDFTSCLLKEEVDQVMLGRKTFEQGLATCLFYLNTQRKPLDNPLVRRAIATAIDRSAIARLFHSNHLAYTATGIVPSSMDIIPDGFFSDIRSAKKLIDESGVDPGARELTLSTICGQRPYLPNPRKAAEAIEQQLAPLGFRIKVAPTKDLDDYFNCTSNGDYDMMLSGWIPDTPKPADFLEVVLSSKNIPGGDLTVMTSVNLARYKSDEMDDALREYRDGMGDKKARQRISDLLSKEVPVIAIMYGPDIMVHSWRVQNVPKGFSDLPLFAELRISDK